MITKKEFDKLSLKEQLKYFEDLGVDFIVEKSAEKVFFEEKEDSEDVLVAFYDCRDVQWGILKRLKAWSKCVEADYVVVTANGSYEETAELQPIKILEKKDLFEEDESEKPPMVYSNLNTKD